jgi:hypothetical protein
MRTRAIGSGAVSSQDDAFGGYVTGGDGQNGPPPTISTICVLRSQWHYIKIALLVESVQGIPKDGGGVGLSRLRVVMKISRRWKCLHQGQMPWLSYASRASMPHMG